MMFGDGDGDVFHTGLNIFFQFGSFNYNSYKNDIYGVPKVLVFLWRITFGKNIILRYFAFLILFIQRT